MMKGASPAVGFLLVAVSLRYLFKGLMMFVKLENLDDPGEIGAQNQVHVDFGVQ